jgi:tRNA dimethylallyltransferase
MGPASQPAHATDFARECWFLTGPTAAGKTRVALELARMLHAEIVSLDSMAVYRGMDIGTAKPAAAERALVPHHLIDLVDPDTDYSLAQYVDAAGEAVADIRRRGRQVLFVGGTPLYLKSLLRGIFQGPPADWAFRRQLKEEGERLGAAALHERLRQVDPAAADRLHPNDTRRIIRALEVYRSTGLPISRLQTQFDEGRPAHECRVFVLDWPREILHRRIDARVGQMIELGFVEEVRQLRARFPCLSRTAAQAVGYREMLDHLDGQCSRDEAIAQICQRTRQLAKRQGTWFRSLSECRRLVQEEGLDAAEVADRIVAAAADHS